MESVAHTVSGEKLAYTVQNLTPDTAYKFEVWAYNSQGPGKAVRVFGRTSEAGTTRKHQSVFILQVVRKPGARVEFAGHVPTLPT